MNRDDKYIKLALKAGFGRGFSELCRAEFLRFAHLVAAAEREECARIVEEMHWRSDAYHAIRARGEDK